MSQDHTTLHAAILGIACEVPSTYSPHAADLFSSGHKAAISAAAELVAAGSAQQAGKCAQEQCQCLGDTPAQRATCMSWTAEQSSIAGTAKSGITNTESSSSYCLSCRGEGIVRTGCDEASSTQCNACDGTGYERASQATTGAGDIEKDAARYRYLMRQMPCNIADLFGDCVAFDEVDDEIDTAIEAEKLAPTPPAKG